MNWSADLVESQKFQTAFGHQSAGRTDEATALYLEILETEPEHPPTLYMLALLLIPTSTLTAAAMLGRYIELRPTDPLGHYGLGMLRRHQGAHEAALQSFGRAVTFDPKMIPAYQGIVGEQQRLGRFDQALMALDCLIALDDQIADAYLQRGVLLAETDRADDALAAFRRALELDPGLRAAHCHMANIHELRNELAEARDHRAAAAREMGVVVQPCTGPDRAASILFLCGTGQGDVPIDYLFDQARFDKIIAFPSASLTGAADLGAYIDSLPAADIIFNVIADPDHGESDLALAAALAQRLPIPLLNPPAKIDRTRRDLMPELLKDIPGLLAPITLRAERDQIAHAASSPGEFEQPFLIRPVRSHGGSHLDKIDRKSDLTSYLGGVPFEQFYVTDYCDYRSEDGYFRKYRFIFVNGVVFPYHLAIMDHWKIHYFRTDMAAEPWMKREEEAFLANYRDIFPGALGEAVQEVAVRLALDYAGMDCSITPDGRLVVFEANAGMLVHLRDRIEDYPYKHRYVPRIRDAVSQLVISRIGH